jgi:exonuclease VII small subunit
MSTEADTNFEQIVKALEAGIAPREIATALGLSTAYVYRVRQRAAGVKTRRPLVRPSWSKAQRTGFVRALRDAKAAAAALERLIESLEQIQ